MPHTNNVFILLLLVVRKDSTMVRATPTGEYINTHRADKKKKVENMVKKYDLNPDFFKWDRKKENLEIPTFIRR
jgi:hypothetical protein